MAVISLVVLLLVYCVEVRGDYSCLCNYAVERQVQAQTDDQASPIGYLYEFDCKEILTYEETPPGWSAIAFEHQRAYVKDGDGQHVARQVCPGNPPTSDALTTRATTTEVITPKPTTTTTQTTTQSTTLPTTQTTTQSTTLPTTTTQTTTQSTTLPTTTTQTTTQSTTLPTTTTTTTTTPRPSTTVTSPTRIVATTTTQSSTAPLFPNFSPMRLVTSTVKPIVGNTNLCPAELHRYAQEDGGALTQYGDSCYELVPIRAIWSKAEQDCMAKGGDLFHIDDQGLQDYIYRWIKSYNFDHAVWTGLHDVRTEEHFEWISGDHVIYTNWHSDRKGNLASHYNEDCVLFVPYAPYYGKWDDVICGSTTVFGDIGQQNPFICEYSIRPHHAVAVVG